MRLKKIISLFLAIILTITSFCSICVFSYTDNYPNTHTNTGDEIADIVAIAKTQVGYSEATNGGYTKYGAFRGAPTAAWCNFFVQWVLDQAGVGNSRFPVKYNSGGYINNRDTISQKYNAVYHKAGSNYTPQAGDIFLTGGHMGLVIGDGTIIHGNVGDAVKYGSLVNNYTEIEYWSKYDKIEYYVTPAYNASTLKVIDRSSTLTAAVDNAIIRTGPYQTNEIVKKVKLGTTLNAVGEYTNIHNHLWYKLDDGNWIYSERVTATPSNVVSFNSSSSTLKNTKQKKVAMPAPVLVKQTQDYVIPGPVPTLDGYKFLGYSTKKDATSAEYQIGDTIKNVTGNVNLYPVWKKTKTTMKLDTYNVALDISKNVVQYNVGVTCDGTLAKTDVFSVQSDNKNVVSATCQSSNNYKNYILYDKESNTITLNAISGGSANVVVTLKDAKGNIRISQSIYVTVDQSYTIKMYDSDGNVKQTQTKKYNKNLTLSDYVPEKEGYSFMGWTTTNGSTTVEYGPGDLYQKNSNLNLYPVWLEKYEIRYSTSGTTLTISGKGDMASYPTGKAPWNSYKSTITKIVVESGVTSIGANAFENFTALTQVTLPYGIVKLGAKAFYNCTSLTKINFPASLTSYGSRVFKNCKALESATIPNASGLLNARRTSDAETVEIGAYAFENCVSLSSVNIPSNVLELGEGAYSGCTGIETVTVSDGITEIDDNVFYGCSSIDSVIIPSNIDTIGDGAFSGCTGLTNLVISEGVENIGDQAFSGCSALESVELPETTEELGSGVFSACSALEEVTLPESLDYVGDAMFSGCSSLASIDIPDSVTYIGDGAFRSCSALEEIDLPENVSVISNDTFYGCSSLTDVTVPSTIASVGDYAFASCENLKSLTLDEGVSEIGVCSFAFCSALETASLPASITLIDDGAFMDCSSLKTVDMLEASVAIGEDAFSGCSVLEDIQIPDSVVSVGENAFSDCSALTLSCFSSSSVYDQITETYSDVVTLTSVTGIVINEEDATIDVGTEKALTASIQPADATDKSVTWRSDNESVATVDSNGNVKAVSGGVANIYVTSNDGLFSDSVAITVNVPVESVHLSYNEVDAYVGETFTIGYTMNPSNPTNIDVEWISSDENIATVDENGLVEIVSAGKVDITIKTADGGFTDTCTITCEKYIATESINIEQTELELKIGDSAKLSATCLPENATEKSFGWMIKDDSDIISIDENGNVTGLKEGIAYVYATNGEVESAECKINVIHASDHTPAEPVKENEKAATCTAEGSYDSVIYCSACGKEMSRENVIIPALGHNEQTRIENETFASCSESGSYDLVTYCTVCGIELSRETITKAKDEHVPGNAVKENEKAATCTAEGSYDSVVYCSVCNAELSREAVTIPATGHKAAAAVKENEKAATCTAEGSYDSVVYCSVCNAEISRKAVPIAKTSHSDTDRDGYCDVCGTVTDDSLINPCRNAAVNVASAKTIDYRSKVIITATASNVPSGYYLAIYVNGSQVAKDSNTEVSYTIDQLKSDVNYTVKVIDANNNVQKDASGNDLSKDGGKVTCNAGFFKKLIAFFKGLFKSLPTVTVKP